MFKSHKLNRNGRSKIKSTVLIVAIVLILVLGVVVIDTFVKVFLVFPLGLGKNKADINSFYGGVYEDPLSNEISEFFPEYSDIENGEVISFFHRDQRWRTPNLYGFHYPSVWYVDIQYTHDEYFSQKSIIINEICSPLEINHGEHGDFMCVYAASDRSDKYDIAKCIYYNDASFVIRYVFMYKTYRNGDESYTSFDDIHTSIIRNASIDWYIDD